METYQGEIFLLYIVQNKPLSQVREHLLKKHGFEVPVKALKTKLMQWGYTKNIKRGEARQILREKEGRDAAGKSSTFTLRQRPVALDKVAKHGHRAGLTPQAAARNGGPAASNAGITSTSNRQIACRTPPPPATNQVPSNLLNNRWVPSENILFHVDTLIKGSFEAGKWRFNGNEYLIRSSPSQDAERKTLHSFLSHLIDGSAAATKSRNFRRAGEHWRQAFLEAENLVSRGEYHDIVPNLVQQINDLQDQGLLDVAEMLKVHVARCSAIAASRNGIMSSSEVYQTLGSLDMVDMSDLEERIMQRFAELFAGYLGPECYSTFVMRMNRARRRLSHQPWTRLEDLLPPVELEELDVFFGRSNRRSLDVLGLRAEILALRGLYCEVEREAKEILGRAAEIRDDEWQRLYHLVRAWFWVGQAQFRLGKWELAKTSLESGMRFAEEFHGLGGADIFEPERSAMKECLEQLWSVDGEHDVGDETALEGARFS